VAGGERPEGAQLEEPHALTAVAEVVDDVLRGAGGRAQEHECALRAVEPVRLHGLVAPPGDGLELVRRGLERVEGGHLRGRERAAQLVVVVRHREGPLRRRVLEVEQRVGDPVLADEGTRLLVGEQLHRLGAVRDREPVHAHEHGEEHVGALGDPRRQQHRVVGLLRVLDEELDRARVADEHRIGVVGVDVDRPRERAVADGHHHRRAHRGRDVDDLGHVREPLGGRRRHRPGARERGADRRRHGGVLRLDVDHLAVGAPVGDERRERLDDRRLRRDRIDRDDVRVDLAHRLRDGLAARQHEPLPRDRGHEACSSATMVIAPVGHISAQTSHPLQWSRSKPAKRSPSSTIAESGQ
jgi:hypothetical protein